MDEPADHTPPNPAAGSGDAPHPIDLARSLFERTAPVLRDVNAAIDRNPVLRDRRDAIAGRAADLVLRAEDAIARRTAIEGIVVDDPASAEPATTAAVPVEPAVPARHRHPHVPVPLSRHGRLHRTRAAIAGGLVLTASLLVVAARRRRRRR